MKQQNAEGNMIDNSTECSTKDAMECISSRQLAASWSTTTGVLMSALSISQRLLYRGLRARGCLYTRFPLIANHRWLRLQWAHEHRAWQADWHQVVFSDELRFNLWDHDGRIRVRGHGGERCLPECVIA
ncbi:HTH_Tnp_Tc3_2 domain-containing protein [Trichonephila clavipes]|nr:HTH_Tnp_Tc3_2 domain-containing protein [Trichonephila clavipes]